MVRLQYRDCLAVQYQLFCVNYGLFLFTNHQVLNYQEVLEENSYYLGCYGSKVDTLQFDSPTGVAVTRDDVIYIADAGNSRIHFLDQLGYELREPITISNCRLSSLAVNKKGNIITTDSQIIKVFTTDGLLSHNFLPMYNKRDQRPNISALAVDKDGNILAADIVNHRIQKFRIDGHFLGFIGGPAFLKTPSGIAVTKHGDVIVSEYESHQLKVFHHHGKSFNTLGRQGIGKAQFMFPRGLAIDNKGNVLVADTMNHRIQVIDMDGKYIASFGRLGSGLGSLDSPYSVAVNRRGHVFVADSGNHRITVFT